MTERPAEISTEAALPGTGVQTTRRHPVLRVAMFGGGCLLILVGFLLGFVPFMPGFPLGMLGIGLLAASSQRVRRRLRAAVNWLPPGWRWRLRKLVRRGSQDKSG